LTNTLEQNLARVRSDIANAARSAGRDPGEIQLVAVTKSVETESALALARLGAVDLGENRIDELERKAAAFRAAGLACRWHFVGHVQTNKAARVAACADVVHSVDSRHLIETLDRNAVRVGRSLGVYLQVKLHSEATKSGLAPADLPSAVEAVKAASGLSWLGLMTMAPLVGDDAARAARLADEVFTRLSDMSRELGGVGLSMGMSDDYALAIRRGSTCVRIGSALFTDAGRSEVGA
jgi:hypothetical protein